MNNFKNRHIKTFAEKFKNREKINYLDFLKLKFETVDLRFNNCPYLGIVYVPLSPMFKDFYHEFEDQLPDICKNNIKYCKFKVVDIDDFYVTLIYKCTHYNNIFNIKIRNDEYLIMGNEVIKDLK